MSNETKGYVRFRIAEEVRLAQSQRNVGMSGDNRQDGVRTGAGRVSGYYRAAATVLMLLCSLLVTAQAAETVTYYYTSPQGTVLATADSAGNVLSSADYRPYGSQALGTPEQGPGYTGHVNDVDSGLTYMQARYQDPMTGRFISTDPKAPDVADIASFNRYAYASNNPAKYTDPDGRQSWCSPGNCGAQSYLDLSRKSTFIQDNSEMVIEVKAGFGVGVEINYSLARAQGEINLLPASLGVEVSANIQSKTPLVVPISGQPTTGKMAIGWGPGIDLALGAKVGIDTKFDPGGKFEINPKVGVGVGEFQQFAPTINLYQWENVNKDSKLINQ